MRGLRIFVSAFLLLLAVTSVGSLVGCSDQGSPGSTKGMIGGRGPDYNN